MRGDTASGGWVGAAYRSEEIEAKLKARGLTSRIHRKGKRGKTLTERAKQSNRTRSSVRVRVEHVFGAQANDMGGTLVRTIGLVCRPGHLSVEPDRQRTALLQRFVIAGPVRGLVSREDRFAHDPRLTHRIPRLNSLKVICATKLI